MLEKVKEFLQRHGALARYVPLILWIGVIFFMSSGEASMSQTSRFIRPILEFLFPNAPEATIELYHAFIRKCAHFIEYGVLAVLAAVTFLISSKIYLQRYWYAAAVGLALLVASLDEFNQSFEPSRTASVWDVVLDLSGAVTAAAVVYGARSIAVSRRNLPKGRTL